jgi:hypothetical protein
MPVLDAGPGRVIGASTTSRGATFGFVHQSAVKYLICCVNLSEPYRLNLAEAAVTLQTQAFLT